MEIDSVDKLVEHIRETGAKFITVDGRDGSGKKTLSQKIHRLLGGTLLSEKKYRSASLDACLNTTGGSC